MIDAFIKRVSVTYKCYEMYAHRGEKIDQEMDAILLIIGIVYGVCRIFFKSVQQCTYFLFSVNLLLVGVNYGQRTMQVCS
jgi:multidrug efflux pump subunit AcrB